MTKIEIITNNVWQINLIPFDRRKATDEEIFKFQERCRETNCFGIGWSIGKITDGDPSRLDADKYIEKYRKNESEKDKKNIKNNINNMKSIRKGDYIFTRLKNGNYYVGKVSNEAGYYSGDDEELSRLSFYSKVEEWKEVTPAEMASEVIGRFSQRNQSTSRRISECNDRRYRFYKYAKTILGEKGDNGVYLDENNFIDCLNPDELEDLVGSYILNNNKGYQIIPSSCKKNTDLIEYIMVNSKGKAITLQVKNKQSIDISKYERIIDSYEKIYLFSDAGYENEDSDYDKNKIILVDKEQLWKHLKTNSKSVDYLIQRIKKYYQLNDFVNESVPFEHIETELKSRGFSQYHGRMGKNKYYIDKDNNKIYIGSWNCLYDGNTDTLVSYWEIDSRIKDIFK